MPGPPLPTESELNPLGATSVNTDCADDIGCALRAVSLRQRAHEHQKLSNNDFSGEVKLHLLPPSMISLSLGHNHFTGRIYLYSLPIQLEFLYLQSNEFYGNVDLSTLPVALRGLNLDDNRFDGFEWGTLVAQESTQVVVGTQRGKELKMTTA